MKKIKTVKRKRKGLHVPKPYSLEGSYHYDDEMEIGTEESIKPDNSDSHYTRNKAERETEDACLIECRKCRKLRWAKAKKIRGKYNNHTYTYDDNTYKFKCNYCNTEHNEKSSAYDQLQSESVKGRTKIIVLPKENAKDS